MWDFDDLRLRATAIFLSFFTLLLCGMARANSFSVEGQAGTGVTADVQVTYQASSATEATITLMVANTTGAPPTHGAVTGFALNLPSSVSGLSDFAFSSTDNGARKFSAVMARDGIGAGSFGAFDLGITNAKIKGPKGGKKSKKSKKNKKNKNNGKAGQSSTPAGTSSSININGGKVKSGINPSYDGTFVISLTGTGLDLLDVTNFLEEFSVGGGNGPENFVVRMQGVGAGSEESDFATGQEGGGPSPIPEPGTLLLLGAGAAGLVRRLCGT
jgi:hypothetical protein